MSSRRARRMTDGPVALRAPDQAAVHLLELLAYTDWPMTVDELRQHGVSAPAQAIYDLQLTGYEIDRVTVHLDGGHQGTGYRLRLPTEDAFGAADPAPSPDPQPGRRSGLTLTAARGR